MESYLKSLVKYSWILILTILVGIFVGAIMSNLTFKKVYKATSTLYIYILNDKPTKQKLEKMGITNNPESTYQSLKSSEMLVADFQQMIKTSSVLNELEEQYKNKDLSDLYNNISVNVQSGTRIIGISVQNGDKSLAIELSNSISNIFKKRAKIFLNLDTVNIIGKADNNTSLVGPSKFLVILGFAFAGLMLGLLTIYIIDFYKLGYRPIPIN